MDLRRGEVGQEVEPRLQHLQPCDLTPSWQQRYQQRRLQMLPGSPFSSNMALSFFFFFNPPPLPSQILCVFVCVLSRRSCEQILIKASDCDKQCQGSFLSSCCSFLVCVCVCVCEKHSVCRCVCVGVWLQVCCFVHVHVLVRSLASFYTLSLSSFVSKEPLFLSSV